MTDINLKLVEYLGLLNLLLYFDNVDNNILKTYKSVSTIIEQLEKNNNLSMNNKRRIKILKSGLENNEQFGHTNIYDYHCNGYTAALFINDNNECFVGYRGTSSNEWKDNVIGLSGKTYATDQQKKALLYFNKLVEKHNFQTSNKNVILFGHSKGGNKSQYVLFNSKYDYLITKVYSFNGQTFSPEAINHYKNILGPNEFNTRISKIYSICTSNDIVNCFGYNKQYGNLINNSQIIYLKSNLHGPIRSHFQDSYFKVNGTLTDICKQGKSPISIQKISTKYMSRSPYLRLFIGNVVYFIYKFTKKTNLDKLIDKLYRSREIKSDEKL